MLTINVPMESILISSDEEDFNTCGEGVDRDWDNYRLVSRSFSFNLSLSQFCLFHLMRVG